MARKKRGAGEGSIFKLPDGRWRAMVNLGYRNGKRWRKPIEARTRQEVQEKLTDALQDHQRGFNITPERQTVGLFLTRWLETIRADVAPLTYVSYEGTVRLHLIPLLGRVPLQNLGANHVQHLKRDLLAKGTLSARTVKYCLVVLRMAVNEAAKLDLVPRNVAMLVDFPKVEQAEIRPYTPEEAKRFLHAAKGHRLGALFSVALALGLRKGEALAIQWPAVDLERGTLAVRLTLQRVKLPGGEKGKLILKEPKRCSRRTVNLPPSCISDLYEHRNRQEQERILAGSCWKEGLFVFTSSLGTPLEPRNTERAFRKILEQAQLPRVRVHDLRHTAATLLLAQGVHPRLVMELLGHSQIAVTMNTYSHVIPALRKEAADKMEEILRPVATVEATVGSAVKPN